MVSGDFIYLGKENTEHIGIYMKFRIGVDNFRLCEQLDYDFLHETSMIKINNPISPKSLGPIIGISIALAFRGNNRTRKKGRSRIGKCSGYTSSPLFFRLAVMNNNRVRTVANAYVKKTGTSARVRACIVRFYISLTLGCNAIDYNRYCRRPCSSVMKKTGFKNENK